MKRCYSKIILMFLMAILPQILFAQWSLVRFDEHNFFTKVVTVTPGSTIVAGIDGVANGSFIMRSNDGGTTWDSIALNSPVTTYSISELDFADVMNGFAGGLKNNSQCLLKTVNNGTTWSEVTPDISLIEPITALSFVNSLSGYVSDGTNLYKTYDGGSSWTTMAPGFIIKDLDFYDMNNGYACGEAVPEAVVMKTIDGGQTWTAILNVTMPFFINSMQKLDVISPDVVYCSAQYSNVLFRTINNGISWDTITLPLIYNIQDYDFINVNEGHVLSTMGEIYGTVDGGLTWTLEYAVAGGAYGPSVYLVSVSFSGTTGYVCGSSGLIKKYTNGTLGLPVTNSSVLTVVYPNPISINESLFIKGETGKKLVKIYNNSGQLVFIKNITNDEEELMLLLENGIYMVQITTAQLNRSQHKLVILK